MIRLATSTVLLLCGFLFSSALCASKKTASLIFPSEEQFLALSEEQQIQYLSGLKDIASKMVHSSSLFADFRYRHLQYLAFSTQATASAADATLAIAEARQQFSTFRMNLATAGDAEKNRLASKPFATLSRAFDSANQTDDRKAKEEILSAYRELQGELSGSLKESLRARTLNYIDTQKIRLQNTVKSPPQTTSSQSPGTRLPLALNPRASGEKKLPPKGNALVEERALSAQAGSSSAIRLNVAAPSPASPASRSAPPKVVNDFKSTRTGCMYAGFILITDRCDAPNNLPEQLKGKTPFDELTFKCERGQAMCNPLLFGFDLKPPDAAVKNCEDPAQINYCFQYATPVCTTARVTATKDCKEKTDNDKYPKRAQALIKAKKDLFTKFTEDFRTICDKDFIEQNKLIFYDSTGKKRSNPDYYKKDVLSTCARAAPQFERLYESTFGSKFDFKQVSEAQSPSWYSETTSGESTGPKPSASSLTGSASAAPGRK